jgi:hypothetical protein
MPVQRSEKGESYFAARCPITGELIIIEHDSSRGQAPYPPWYASVRGDHYQSDHQFGGNEVFPILATGGD